ncbi:expressed unknown protein [Ectocarpus siliculosus]|uniref:Uncharacterized protein n=1 Tax=Ectocarpus siliculosus TaxID=2880 RepID=D8LLL0_ECTSI|nr:expressed unknown protein [Ectocarpus siliculosus]|eukprot:CBN74641.1 expressed unknown protein [Ectocarpus siliculosus]
MPGAACLLQKGACVLPQQSGTQQSTTRTQCGLRIDCDHTFSLNLTVEISAQTYLIQA